MLRVMLSTPAFSTEPLKQFSVWNAHQSLGARQTSLKKPVAWLCVHKLIACFIGVLPRPTLQRPPLTRFPSGERAPGEGYPHAAYAAPPSRRDDKTVPSATPLSVHAEIRFPGPALFIGPRRHGVSTDSLQEHNDCFLTKPRQFISLRDRVTIAYVYWTS